MYLQTFKTFAEGETNKVLHESVVEDRHLVAKFENNGARGSRFERVGSKKLKGNGQIGLPYRTNTAANTNTLSLAITVMRLSAGSLTKTVFPSPVRVMPLAPMKLKELK